jgi:hypothetical protein
VKIRGRFYAKHELIAKHYHGPKPEGAVVDHINPTDKTDNRPENLRYVSRELNTKNVRARAGREYVYLDNLPQDSLKLVKFKDIELVNLYLADGHVYEFIGPGYKQLHTSVDGYIQTTNNGHKLHFSLTSKNLIIAPLPEK